MADPVPEPAGYAVNPAGRVVSQSARQVAEGLQHGYAPTTKEDFQGQAQAGQAADYVDQNWGTVGKALAGVSSGLTLGLGPSLASRIGLVDRGHLEAAEQSGAFQAGDVAGMLAPALLTGGEAVGARGAIANALRFTPAGAMAEAGAATERLASQYLKNSALLGTGASGAIGMAARGATEGALINMSHQASQDIIANKPLAAQSLLAAGTDGALFGGLTGGLLGGVSAVASRGVDAVSGRAGAALAGDGERAAATALKHLGADVEGYSSGELVQNLKRYNDVLNDAGGGIGQDTRSINASAKKAYKNYSAITEDSVQLLDKGFPANVPQAQRVTSRIETDVMAHYDGRLDAGMARKVVDGLKEDMAGLKTWKNWTESRDVLAERAQAPGLKGDVYKTALNAYDSELRTAMEAADPKLAKAWAAATVSKKAAAELVDMSGNKVSRELGRDGLKLTPHDASTLSFGVLTGANPVIGMGIIAGRKIVNHVSQKMEPVIAEYAARSALGASAGAAQARIGQRISSGLKSFLSSAPKVAYNAQKTPSEEAKGKLSYSMKSYQNALQLADDLTSASHQAKVREVMQAMTEAGHPEMGKELGMTYGRAVAYVNAVKPKGVKGGNGNMNLQKQMGLTKPPKTMSPSTQGMKFQRVIHSLNDPMGSLIDGLARGDVSRDAVAAVKYVYPDIHQEIVMRASQQILDIKAEGKYLPEDKVAMLGTVLGAPIDSHLEKPFIDAVQQGLAANKAPPPPDGSSQQPTTDVSSFQTPLQSAVG